MGSKGESPQRHQGTKEHKDHDNCNHFPGSCSILCVFVSLWRASSFFSLLDAIQLSHGSFVRQVSGVQR